MVEFIKHQKCFKRKTKKGHQYGTNRRYRYCTSSAFMNMFAMWLDDLMSSGKSGFSKQTFLSCIQTSRSFPLLVKHLLESKQLGYILTGNIQSDPLKKKVWKVLSTQWSKLFWAHKAVFTCRKIYKGEISHQIICVYNGGT